MTREEFLSLLTRASESALVFAQRYVENELPKEARYHVLLNQSYDNSASVDEVVYPKDELREFACLTQQQVADLLVREDRCPEWIDIAVEALAVDHTRLRLVCCGRYTADTSRLYYAHQGTGPFGIKSPNLPPGWAEGSKFRIPRV
jgi:hypothetical protein